MHHQIQTVVNGTCLYFSPTTIGDSFIKDSPNLILTLGQNIKKKTIDKLVSKNCLKKGCTFIQIDWLIDLIDLTLFIHGWNIRTFLNSKLQLNMLLILIKILTVTLILM